MIERVTNILIEGLLDSIGWAGNEPAETSAEQDLIFGLRSSGVTYTDPKNGIFEYWYDGVVYKVTVEVK